MKYSGPPPGLELVHAWVTKDVFDRISALASKRSGPAMLVLGQIIEAGLSGVERDAYIAQIFTENLE
jgi:hypothetical protein